MVLRIAGANATEQVYEQWSGRGSARLRAVTSLPTDNSLVTIESLPETTRLTVSTVDALSGQLAVLHELSVNSSREVDCHIVSMGITMYMAADGLFWLRESASMPSSQPDA